MKDLGLHNVPFGIDLTRNRMMRNEKANIGFRANKGFKHAGTEMAYAPAISKTKNARTTKSNRR